MPIAEGQPVPEVIFKARVRNDALGGPNPFEWKDVSSADLFKGRGMLTTDHADEWNEE